MKYASALLVAGLGLGLGLQASRALPVRLALYSIQHPQADATLTDANGNYIIPETSHMRLAAPANNGGAQILRRSYSYNDGANFVAERWPPWHQGIEYDSGLFFQAYQKDPRTGFVRIFDKMSKIDALNQFTTHVGSAIFACPPGGRKGEYIGQTLFEAV
jgi:deferrochelatase/peroxidase EfeB